MNPYISAPKNLLYFSLFYSMTNLSYKYTTIYALLQRFKFAASFAFRPKTAYNKQIYQSKSIPIK